MTMILKKDFTSFNYRLFVLPAFMRAFLSRVRRMANFPIIQKMQEFSPAFKFHLLINFYSFTKQTVIYELFKHFYLLIISTCRHYLFPKKTRR